MWVVCVDGWCVWMGGVCVGEMTMQGVLGRWLGCVRWRGDQFFLWPNELGAPCPPRSACKPGKAKGQQHAENENCDQWLDHEARTTDSSVGGAASTRGARTARFSRGSLHLTVISMKS